LDLRYVFRIVFETVCDLHAVLWYLATPERPRAPRTAANCRPAGRGEIPDNCAVVRRVAGRDEDSAGRML